MIKKLLRMFNVLSLNFFIASLLMFFSSGISYAQSNSHTDSIKFAFKEGDLKYLQRNLYNIDDPIASGEYSPLIYAIHQGNRKVIRFLLAEKNANPNIRSKGLTPLMHAVKIKGSPAIRLLVENGAKINDVDSVGSHALMMAAILQPASVIRLLFRHGVWLNHRNKLGYTAYDMAIIKNNKRASTTLRKLFEEHLPAYTDGPYIEYLPKNQLKITYLKHDSLRRIFSKKENVIPLEQFNTSEQSKFLVHQTFTRDSTSYSNVKKLVIIGDIHGQCDTLKKFLITNRITDTNLNWIFGKGHIVFLGDMVDRGEKVTETLWLIYNLERQAEATGGKVHVLLGNHELMLFSGDTRYLADKYAFLTKGVSVPYQKLYSSKTVLGKWLRSKNAVVKINDNLFVHGGLHPQLVKERITLDSINTLIYKYVNAKKKEKHAAPALHFILGDNGPFWFRGLITYEGITEKDVDLLLQFYNARRIFVGHSKSRAINILYNQKVWGMDVPFYLYTGSPMQALLIDNDSFQKLNSSEIPEN
jgi:ankyrin repeat protein